VGSASTILSAFDQRRAQADQSALLQPDDTAHALGHRLEEAWNKRKKALPKTEVKEGEKAPRPNLTGALTAAYGGPFFMAALFKLLQDTLAFVQPQLLRRLLQFVASFKSDDPEPAFHGYILAFAMLRRP
jgi:ATP-binding cassette, subfamily C (CFTR/MRP), member 1